MGGGIGVDDPNLLDLGLLLLQSHSQILHLRVGGTRFVTKGLTPHVLRLTCMGAPGAKGTARETQP
jgi:hypothetical protein